MLLTIISCKYQSLNRIGTSPTWPNKSFPIQLTRSSEACEGITPTKFAASSTLPCGCIYLHWVRKYRSCFDKHCSPLPSVGLQNHLAESAAVSDAMTLVGSLPCSTQVTLEVSQSTRLGLVPWQWYIPGSMNSRANDCTWSTVWLPG